MELSEALGFGDSELVAFVGAGGKKTAMARLAERARERGLRGGYTTTTHTPPPAYPLVLTDRPEADDALRDAPSPVAFAAKRVENPDRASEKVRGYEPAVLNEVFERERFDWLLVKADGARRREFKAPGPDEPVVPSRSTHVVPVASVLAVGEPLDEATVHRPERVAAITDLAAGDEITPAAVGTVLASDAGGCKGVPPDATVTPLVNKADTHRLRERARAILDVALARTDRFTSGLVCSFETDTVESVEQA